MEYYYEFQSWLYQTSFYQDILKELPVPLNNIHFDSVVIIGVGAYAVYRVVDGMCYGIYRRHIRRKQEKNRKLQWEREKEMISRELQVQQKEENLGRFLAYLERTSIMGWNRGRGCDVQNIQGQRQSWVGQKDLRLEMNAEVDRPSDYDSVMDAFTYDAEQSMEVNQKRSVEKEQMFNRMSELDNVLRVREIDDGAEVIVDWVEDPAIVKRKEKARKKAEKERQRAEKKRKKEEKRQEKLQKKLQKKLNSGMERQRMQDKLQKGEADGRDGK